MPRKSGTKFMGSAGHLSARPLFTLLACVLAGCVSGILPRKIDATTYGQNSTTKVWEYNASDQGAVIGAVGVTQLETNQLLEVTAYCEQQLNSLRKRAAAQARTQRALAVVGALAGVAGSVAAASADKGLGRNASAVVAATGAGTASLGTLFGDPLSVLQLYRQSERRYEKALSFAAAAGPQAPTSTLCDSVPCKEAIRRELASCGSGAQ